MKLLKYFLAILCVSLLLVGCGRNGSPNGGGSNATGGRSTDDLQTSYRRCQVNLDNQRQECKRVENLFRQEQATEEDVVRCQDKQKEIERECRKIQTQLDASRS